MTRAEQLMAILEKNAGTEMTARKLAEEFVKEFPEEAAAKMSSAKDISNEKILIDRLAGEISGVYRKPLQEMSGVQIDSSKTPRTFLFVGESTDEQTIPENPVNEDGLLEKDLYPLLGQWLADQFSLLSMRIDDKKSSKKNGTGGNKWLHPDVVAMERKGPYGSTQVQSLVGKSVSDKVKLWSFEVKNHLSTVALARDAIFQCFSDSSWANLAYLAAANISDKAMSELRMLCNSYGVGLIRINPDSKNCEIVVQAKEKRDIEWKVVDRIVAINDDFGKYLEQVRLYVNAVNEDEYVADNFDLWYKDAKC